MSRLSYYGGEGEDGCIFRGSHDTISMPSSFAVIYQTNGKLCCLFLQCFSSLGSGQQKANTLLFFLLNIDVLMKSHINMAVSTPHVILHVVLLGLMPSIETI